jgi:hypothetical protein
LALAMVVGACSVGGPATPPDQTTPDVSPYLAPLERANEVADQVNQREAIYEEMNR